jgi:hypothetical protein
MNTQKKILHELKCAVCGDVLLSDAAQQCSSVNQKALSRHAKHSADIDCGTQSTAREQKSVGCAVPARAEPRNRCSDRPARGTEPNLSLSLGDG